MKNMTLYSYIAFRWNAAIFFRAVRVSVNYLLTLAVWRSGFVRICYLPTTYVRTCRYLHVDLCAFEMKNSTQYNICTLDRDITMYSNNKSTSDTDKTPISAHFDRHPNTVTRISSRITSMT